MSGKKHDIVTLELTSNAETDAAYMFLNVKGKAVWIPKSQCEYSDGELQLPEWLALDKELI